MISNIINEIVRRSLKNNARKPDRHLGLLPLIILLPYFLQYSLSLSKCCTVDASGGIGHLKSLIHCTVTTCEFL